MFSFRFWGAALVSDGLVEIEYLSGSFCFCFFSSQIINALKLWKHDHATFCGLLNQARWIWTIVAKYHYIDLKYMSIYYKQIHGIELASCWQQKNTRFLYQSMCLIVYTLFTGCIYSEIMNLAHTLSNKSQQTNWHLKIWMHVTMVMQARDLWG